MAALVQLGNDKTSKLRFVNWTNRGITFLYSDEDNEKIHVVFSPANNLITRLHLYPKTDDEYTYNKLDLFCKKVLGSHNLSSVNRDLRKEFASMKEVYTGTNDFNPQIFGKIEKGKYVIGQHTNKRLDYLPAPRPPRLPDEESAWPTLTQTPGERPAPPQEKTKEPPAQGAINTPPSPLQAIKLYLEHLNSVLQ